MRAIDTLPREQCIELKSADLAAQGFDEGLRGVHTSRTMMLAELENVLERLPAGISPAAVRAAIVDGNILGKATRSGRKNSAVKLINLYSFEPEKPLFAGFRTLWMESSRSRPVLAILLAQCRDAVLRAGAQLILAAPIGAAVTKEQFYQSLLSGFASRYAETTLQSTTRNVAASWRQSGHLTGNDPILRAKAPADFHALAFAVFIGYLRGLRGQVILASDWVRLLDFEPAELEAALAEAHRHGLITGRKIGDVIDLKPGPHLPGGDAG